MIAITPRPCSDNWHRGREGWEVDQLTIHITEGDRAGVRSWFNTRTSDVSAHYMVCRDGSIDQFVDEADTALHNGVVVNPVAPLVVARPSVNPNLYSIGIEHEGKEGGTMTPEQERASLELIEGILKRHPKITLDRKHIVGHREVRANKSCPGGIHVDEIVQKLKDRAGMLPVENPLRWSAYFKDWLIPTKIVSDREWYFVRLRDVQMQYTAGESALASTPYSEMPRKP